MGLLEELKSKNYYEILNVPRDASVDAIKESYKEIAKIYHPDSNYYTDIIELPVSMDQSDVFKLITLAYNTLVSPEKRAFYDNKLPKELRGWEDEDSFWDYKQTAEQMQKSKNPTQTNIRRSQFISAHKREQLIRGAKVNIDNEMLLKISLFAMAALLVLTTIALVAYVIG